jgi:mannose/cellobiose epimerase-like protein (N-acyl-D-glucosamine 2-epimerase family)
MRYLSRLLLHTISAALVAAVPGQRWLDHFQEDLLPYWNVPTAWGTPRGNFPTFRCNDGSLVNEAKPCTEIRDAPVWIKENIGLEFTRMKSRQTYFYCVAYHLTGDPEMLKLAQQGVQFIRTHALEKDTGSAISYWENGVPGPLLLERTSQDLAYAGLGLAMYYYLTRDPDVLVDIIKLKKHIFEKYWNQEWGMLRWTVNGPIHETERMELVAQLDQVNAYLLLLAPIVPASLRTEWKDDLVRLARVMIEKYYVKEWHLFRGTLNGPKQLGGRSTDFGHTAKALWMIGRIGRLAGDEALIRFADTEAVHVLRMARLPDGTWGFRLLPDGTVEDVKEWWAYAELDQLAETMALVDHQWVKDLDITTTFWMDKMVDHQNHEVWGEVSGKGEVALNSLKIHQWKNGFHSAEHALVGYITSQALDRKPVTLYFAVRDRNIFVKPYLFSGKTNTIQFSKLAGMMGLSRMKVKFSGIH